MTVLSHSHDPHDVVAHAERLAPGSHTEFTTERNGYRFKSTASPDVLAQAIALAQAGDLSHIRARLIPQIKRRADTLILGRKALTQQLNTMADGLDLLLETVLRLIVLLGLNPLDVLTQQQWDRLFGGRDLYRDYVQPIRAKSDDLERDLLRMTREQLLAAEESGWPDQLWPIGEE